jgi:hypothetical protein
MKIEKNIPIPSKNKTGMTNILKSMEIGDSFLGDMKKVVSAQNCASQSAMKVSYRKQESGTFRIWRTA